MFKCIFLAVVAVTLTSCSNLTIQNFDRSPLSLASNNKAEIVLVRNTTNDWSASPIIQEYLKLRPEFNQAVTRSCSTLKPMVNPVLIPVVTSLGKLIFDMQIDKNTREIQKLKQAAQSSYVSKIIIPNSEFNQSACAIIYRYNQKDKSIGFVSLLKLESKGDGFIFTPTYIKANNTLAITKQPENGRAANVNASIAVSVKAIVKEINGLPQLTSIGEGVTTAVNIDVGPNEKASCIEGCDSSDLVPYITDSNKFVSVSFAVTETGKLGINLDEKLAEVKALKEAIGPALKDSLKEYLEKINE